MENGPFSSLIYLFKVVIFNSHVSWPEGIYLWYPDLWDRLRPPWIFQIVKPRGPTGSPWLSARRKCLFWRTSRRSTKNGSLKTSTICLVGGLEHLDSWELWIKNIFQMDTMGYLAMNIWLVVWNHGILWSFRNVIIPTDELIFFRGVGQPPTSCRWFDLIRKSMNIIYNCRWCFFIAMFLRTMWYWQQIVGD